MNLFGSKPATSTGSAFPFGATTSTASTMPKPLFGSTAPAASTPSLFGSTTTAAGGLFGSTTTTTAASTATSGGLFGSPATTTSGGLFGKPATTTPFGGGSSLFGPKPATGGLFGAPAAQPAAQAITRQRETLQGLMQNADAVVRSLTTPELYGDERDQIIGKLNQVAAALGVGAGMYKDGQSVPYSKEGPFHRFKAIGYNTASEFTEEDGIVSLLLKIPHTELSTSAQKVNVKTAIYTILGSQPNLSVKIKSIKALPDNVTELNIFVVNKTSGTPAKSSDLARILSEPAKKQQLETQIKVDKIMACVAMDRYQKERFFKNPPVGFDDSAWQQACRENPDAAHLVPHPIRGFSELLQRQKAQQTEVDMENKVIDQLLQQLSHLSSSSEAAQVRIQQQKITQKQLSHRLLRVLCVQLMQQRFGHGIDQTEEKIRGYLEILVARLNAPQQIKPRLAEMLDVLRDSNSELRQKCGAAPSCTLSESDVEQLEKYLLRCQDGLESLSAVVKDNLAQLQRVASAINE